LKRFSVKGFNLEQFCKKCKYGQNDKGLKFSRVGRKRKAGFLARMQHFGQVCSTTNRIGKKVSL